MSVQSIVIGLGHRARQGKDEVASAIIAGRPEYDIKRYSFAQELKQEVNKNAMGSGGMIKLFDNGLRAINFGGYMQANGEILPLPEWVQYDPDAPMDDPDCPYGKQRTLLQWWGGEFRRSVDPLYWIKKVEARIEKENPQIALLTDVRYPNEFEWCRKYGEVVKVVRPGTSSPNEHASETALAHLQDWEWSAVIYNNGTLEQLKQQAVFVFDEILDSVPQ